MVTGGHLLLLWCIHLQKINGRQLLVQHLQNIYSTTQRENPAVLSIEPRDPYFMDSNPQIRYNCVVFHPLYHKTTRNPCFIAQYGIIQ